MKKSNLVIVYHRQPYEEIEEDGKIVYREHKSPNGIVPTLKSFFGAVERGAWVAWKQVDPKSKDKDFEQVVRMSDSYGEYNVSRLPLSAAQVRSFYHVTSKEALWPILHSFPERYNYDAVDWPVFREVNRLFAEAAVAQAEQGATIWVHDYNLWLVPGYVRKLRPDVRIAFFHHTPFPSSSIFNILPWRDEIMDSLLACDHVGFHIPRYASGFVAAARNLKGVEIVEEVDVEDTLSPVGLALSEASVATRIRHQGRDIRVDSLPVGTNVRYIREVAANDETAERDARIRKALDGRRLILSVGRSDYTKGTRDMLLAFERLLESRPELASDVQLLVTSVAAATGMGVYRKVQHEIEQIAGRINGRFGTLASQPLLLMTSAIPFEELIAYYRCADVCWITPLRDGLNLVAKEYVAARRGMDGVLVLSEFTGASVELADAVLVNPYSRHLMDEAIERALEMPVEEQRTRMQRMGASVEKYDATRWATHTLESFRQM
jgi:glucosylglycerol-phosphate synthase